MISEVSTSDGAFTQADVDRMVARFERFVVADRRPSVPARDVLSYESFLAPEVRAQAMARTAPPARGAVVVGVREAEEVRADVDPNGPGVELGGRELAEVRGDSIECGPIPFDVCGYPAIGEPRTLDDVWVPEPGASPFVFEGVESCEQDLMERVWAVLVLNIDLVEWALCIAHGMYDRDTDCAGGEGSVDCVLNALTRPRWNPIRIRWAQGCADEFRMVTNTRTQSITVCGSCHTAGSIAAFLYCNDRHERDRMCAVFAMAASFLHEVTHLCDFEHRPWAWSPALGCDPVPGAPTDLMPCSFPYLAGNYFAWAMAQRYPDAMASPCCDRWAFRYATRQVGGTLPESELLPSLSGACSMEYRFDCDPHPEIELPPFPDAPPPRDGWVPPVGVPDVPNLYD